MQLSRSQCSPTRADVDKRLRLEGLSLGESPPAGGRHSCGSSSSSSSSRNHNSSSHGSRFRLAPPDAGGKSGSESSHVRSGARRLSLPHTITERHGGRELWVRAPTVAGELSKRGFRWRRKWQPRYVELDGRELSYFALEGGAGHRSKPKRRVQLKASGALENVDALSFSVLPAAGEQPWVLRAKDAVTKLRWCRAISDCFDILAWLKHYSLGAVLGVGGNGVVQELVDKRDGAKSAVKILDVAKFRNRDAVIAEVEILRNITNSIKHPNLMTIHKVYEEQGKIYIIQDLCTGGELYDAVVHRGRYSERDAARLMRQLMSALQALHAHNILHLDIKPENILLATPDENDQRIVLTDFGLARMVNGKQNPLENGATSMAGTIGYMAPEVITSHMYTEAADVFSAGVILFILLVGYPPFRGDSEVETLLKIARGDLQFDANDWAGVSMPAKELVARMLEVRAQDRITVDEVLAHPWMSPENVDTANGEPAMLDRAVERLQRFNYDRKSENMGSLMGSLLLTSETAATEADYSALLDTTTIDTMIRQLSPDGRDRIPLDRAHMLARGLGLSPFVDVQSFVAFLDQNHDGFIDAADFCEGVRAMRSHDKSFATVIFAAYCKMVNVPLTPNAQLRRRHFKSALEQLECPEPLQKIFFRFVDDEEQAQDAEFAIDRAGLAALLDQFSFLGLLFLRTAKENVVSIVRARSIDDMPRISEDSLSSP